MSKRISKEDHKTEMVARRIRQRARESDFFWPITKHDDPKYRREGGPE